MLLGFKIGGVDFTMLTKKQCQLLLFIHERLRENGIPPSFDEMKEALALQSKSGIHRLVTGLEERGFVRRLPHRARALEVIRLPHTPEFSSLSGVVSGGLSKSGKRRGVSVVAASNDGESVSLPLCGKIAAGTPAEALCVPSGFVGVSSALLGRGEHYALTVEGDSMVEAGILDGDTVIIQKCDRAESGTIVVALVDGVEATLKRLRCRGHAVALEPANRAYETRIFASGRVKIQGRLVGLTRVY